MDETGHKCECGCGGETRKSPCAYHARGIAKGDYNRFLQGHGRRGLTRHLASRWTGGKILSHGYARILKPEHPRADSKGYVYEHILIVEAVTGKLLLERHEVHHVNGNKADNRNGDLVVCESLAYHRLLHLRSKALRACGHPDWRVCSFCKGFSPPQEMTITKDGRVFHNKCRGESRREKYRSRKEMKKGNEGSRGSAV